MAEPKDIPSLIEKIELIHGKQDNIFKAFYRLYISVIFDGNQIPLDIVDCCYLFYEVNLLSFLPDNKDNTQTLENYKYNIWRNWVLYRKLKYSSFDYIDFELTKLFIDDQDKARKRGSKRIMAQLLARWNQNKEAESLFVDLISNSSGWDACDRWTIHYEYGNFLKDQHRYSSAIEYFSKLPEIAADSNPAYGYHEIAWCYYKLQDLEKAKWNYIMAVNQKENLHQKAVSCFDYSRVLMWSKDVETSTKYAIDAVKYDPTYISAVSNLAYVMREKGYFKESEKYYLKCLAINDAQRNINEDYAYLLFLMKQYEKAMKYINIEIKRQSYLGISQRTYYYHGIINKAAGNDDAADQSFAALLATIKTEADRRQVINDLAVDKTKQESHDEYYEKLIARVEQWTL